MPERRRGIDTTEDANQAIAAYFGSENGKNNRFSRRYDALRQKGIQPLMAACGATSAEGNEGLRALLSQLGELDEGFFEQLCHQLEGIRSNLEALFEGSDLRSEARKLAARAGEWLSKNGIGTEASIRAIAELQTGSTNRIIFHFERMLRESDALVEEPESSMAVWAKIDKQANLSFSDIEVLNETLATFGKEIEALKRSQTVEEIYDVVSRILARLKRCENTNVKIVGNKFKRISTDSKRVAQQSLRGILELHVDSSVLAYHVTKKLFELAGNTEGLAILVPQDRDFAVNKLRAEVESVAKINTLKRIADEGLRPFGPSRREVVIQRYEERVEEYRLQWLTELNTWLKATGLGRGDFRKAVSNFVDEPTKVRDDHIFTDYRTLPEAAPTERLLIGSFWVNVTPELGRFEKANIAELLRQLTTEITRVPHCSTWPELYNAWIRVTGAINFLKERGINVSGVNFNGEGSFRYNFNFEGLPKELTIHFEPALFAHALALKVIGITGIRADSFNRDDRRRAATAITSKNRISEMGGTALNKMNNWTLVELMDFLDLHLSQPKGSLKILNDFAQAHDREDIGNELINLRVINNVQADNLMTTDYVAGELSGMVNPRHFEGKRILELFLSRPRPEAIEIAEGGSGNLVCQGRVNLLAEDETGNARHQRIEWRMDSRGDLFFIFDGEEYGPENFSGRENEYFYQSLKGSILKGLEDALIRRPAEEAERGGYMLTTPAKPEQLKVRGEGEVVFITPNYEKTREAMLAQLVGQSDEDAQKALNQRLLRLQGIRKKDFNIDLADLEGFDLYIVQNILAEAGEARVHVVGDTRELLAAVLEDPSLKRHVFLLERRGHVGRAGYKASRRKDVAFRTQKNPGDESEAVRRAIEWYFDVKLRQDVLQQTNVTIPLGPHLDDPKTRWIILGPEEGVGKYREMDVIHYRTGLQEDGCCLIKVEDLYDAESGAIKEPLPDYIEGKPDIVAGINDEWLLSLTVCRPQVDQFFRGQYMSLEEAERRLEVAETEEG